MGFTDWFTTLFARTVAKRPANMIFVGNNLISHFSKRVLILAQKHDIQSVSAPPNAEHLKAAVHWLRVGTIIAEFNRGGYQYAARADR